MAFMPNKKIGCLSSLILNTFFHGYSIMPGSSYMYFPYFFLLYIQTPIFSTSHCLILIRLSYRVFPAILRSILITHLAVSNIRFDLDVSGLASAVYTMIGLIMVLIASYIQVAPSTIGLQPAFCFLDSYDDIELFDSKVAGFSIGRYRFLQVGLHRRYNI